MFDKVQNHYRIVWSPAGPCVASFWEYDRRRRLATSAEYLIRLRPLRRMASPYAGFEHGITIAYCVVCSTYEQPTNYSVYVASTLVAASSTSSIGRYELRVGNTGMDVKARYKITIVHQLRVFQNFEFSNFEYVENGPRCINAHIPLRNARNKQG